MTVIWPLALSDPGDIIKAAEALRISEYDFFRLSFRRWSGREPDEKVLEQAFVAYMFHQTVPPWVRHLAREVLALEAKGRMNIRAFGAQKYRRLPPPSRHGGLYMGEGQPAVQLRRFFAHRPMMRPYTGLQSSYWKGGV